MKTLTRLLTVAALASLFALPSFAQDAAAAANPCESQERTDLYTKYFNEKKNTNDQRPAYDTAKQYLAKFESCNDQYSRAVRKFVDAYEKELTKAEFPVLLYGKDAAKAGRNVPKAFEVGRQMLTANPENLFILINLGYAGYTEQANKNTAFSAESAGYVRKALELLEAGKTPEGWTPFQNREETLSYLNLAAGELNIGSNPAAAMPFYLKAATLEGPAKKEALTYARLAAIYQATQYDPMQADFKAKYEGKDETPESKAALEAINQVIDRIMDAYARAINLAGTDARYAASKKEWTDQLTNLYKFRNDGKTDGLDAFIASSTSKPLPEPFKASAAAPAATPTPTPAATQPATTAERKP